DPGLKHRAGRLAFVWGFLAGLWRYRPCDLVVGADGIEHRAGGFIAARGRFYAGPFIVAPNASLAEPCFELVLFHRAGRRAMLRYAIALLCDRIPRLPDVTVLRAETVTVSGNRAAPAQADGDVVGHLPITLDIAEQPLLLIQPDP